MKVKIGFVVLGFLSLRDDASRQAATPTDETLLSVNEKTAEIRRTYGDIGTIAPTENSLRDYSTVTDLARLRGLSIGLLSALAI